MPPAPNSMNVGFLGKVLGGKRKNHGHQEVNKQIETAKKSKAQKPWTQTSRKQTRRIRKWRTQNTMDIHVQVILFHESRFLGAVLDGSWVPFGTSWGGLGPLLGALEPLLGDLGSVLAALGRSWAALGRFWTALGSSWVALGSSWAALGSS